MIAAARKGSGKLTYDDGGNPSKFAYTFGAGFGSWSRTTMDGTASASQFFLIAGIGYRTRPKLALMAEVHVINPEGGDSRREGGPVAALRYRSGFLTAGFGVGTMASHFVWKTGVALNAGLQLRRRWGLGWQLNASGHATTHSFFLSLRERN